jgi:hypothetical protein
VVITISEDKGNELLENTHDGVTRKLQSVKQLVNFDKEIAAGPLCICFRRIWEISFGRGKQTSQ